MSKDIFDRIVELEGTKLSLTAEEFLLALLSATTELEIRKEITLKEQNLIMGAVTSVVDMVLAEPEGAQEMIKAARLSVHHTQKIAKALNDEDPKEAMRTFLEAIFDRPDKH